MPTDGKGHNHLMASFGLLLPVLVLGVLGIAEATQPDLWIAKKGTNNPIGDGIYNQLAGQTIRYSSRKGRKTKSLIFANHIGNLNSVHDFFLTCDASGQGFRVRYLDYKSRANITSEVRFPRLHKMQWTGWPSLRWVGRDPIEVQVNPTRRARHKRKRGTVIVYMWCWNDHSLRDRVRTITTAR